MISMKHHTINTLFFSECITKYGDTEGGKIWNAINNVYDCLPLAAVIDDKVNNV